jgi:hypothetical protein
MALTAPIALAAQVAQTALTALIARTVLTVVTGPIALAMICLALPVHALAAPTRGDEDATATVRVVAMRLGGRGVAAMHFEISAHDKLFGTDDFFRNPAMASGGPPDWDRCRVTGAEIAGAPAQFSEVLAGVPFTLRGLDVFGREVGTLDCEPCKPGETRMVPLLVEACDRFFLRVVDDDGLPVAGARIEVGRPDSRPEGRPELQRSDPQIGGTDACGACTVPGPLRRDAVIVRVSRSWRLDLEQRVDIPPDGEPVTLRVPSMRPVTVHVVDGNARRVSVAAVFALDDDGGQRIARSMRHLERVPYLHPTEDSDWRVDAVPIGVHCIRAVPAWSAECTVVSALDDVTVVLPTVLVIDVTWDASTLAALGTARLLTVRENDALTHFITYDESDARRAEFALPFGRWTLCLSGRAGTTPIERPIDVRAGGPIEVDMRGR